MSSASLDPQRKSNAGSPSSGYDEPPSSSCSTEKSGLVLDPPVTGPGGSAQLTEVLPHRASPPATTGTVCEACWKGPLSAHLGLFHDPIAYSATGNCTGGYLYSVSREEVKSASEAGCRWCRLVYDNALPASRRQHVREYKHMRGYYWKAWPETGPLAVRVGVADKPRPRDSVFPYSCTPEGTQYLRIIINDVLGFDGYVYTTQDDPAGTHVVVRNRLLDVASPRSLALAKSAIAECTRRHQQCSESRTSSESPQLLPSRLIDCTDLNHPHLVTTNGVRGVYLALSYVWGEDQAHKTTTANLSTYLTGMDPAALPQTIRDAMYLTRALGHRYLWVDSLCILQDSAEDQRREIRRMRHIYRDAYCTIIAASAQRVSEGFLQDRSALPSNMTEDPQLYTVTLPFPCPSPPDDLSDSTSAQIGEVVVSSLPDEINVGMESPRERQLPIPERYNPAWDPIGTRAWCMQELLMSPRSLIFASHTLQFRCQTTTLNVGGAYHEGVYEARLPRVCFLTHPPLVEHDSEEWRDLHRSWQGVVKDYTRRSITQFSDKLVACGGVAEEFRRVLRSDYLAGLWRHSLLFDLLWHRSSGERRPRPKGHGTPSWSWAAVDTAVAYENPVLVVLDAPPHSFAEVVRCEVVLEDTRLPFGQVAGGSLVLRTPLLALTNKADYHDAVGKRGSGVALMDCTESEDEASTQGPLWVAPIRWNRYLMHGLVVALADAHTPDANRYRRVGFFYKNAGILEGIENPLDWVNDSPRVEIEIV